MADEPKEGRPTKLTKEIIKEAKNYCLLGATDIELASFFEVSVATIYNWRNSSPEFLEATRLGKEQANERVERSLYARACGYDKDGKHYPADPGSISLWLRNRDAERWKDKRENEDIDMLSLARRLAHVLTEAADESHTTH